MLWSSVDLGKCMTYACAITSSYKIASWSQNPWDVPAQSLPSPPLTAQTLFTDSTASPLPEHDSTGTEHASNRLLPLDNTHLRVPLSFCGFIDQFFFITECFPFVWKYCRLLILSPMKKISLVASSSGQLRIKMQWLSVWRVFCFKSVEQKPEYSYWRIWQGCLALLRTAELSWMWLPHLPSHHQWMIL